MIEQIQITVDWLSDEERNLTVYVPDRIEGKRRRRYPVLYMFDGQNVFFDEDATYGKSWGMFEYLNKRNFPLIVVGIDSSRNPDNTRLCEYSPYSFDDYHFGYIQGKGKTMLKWMVEELKPYIDKKYPTRKDRHNTWIGGSSMGGLMAYYAIVAHNDVFSRAACLSPSLWAGNQKLVNLTKRKKFDPDTTIFMSYGSEEAKGDFGKNARDSFWACVEKLITKPLTLNIRKVQYASHCEACWEKQVPAFLNLLIKEDN